MTITNLFSEEWSGMPNTPKAIAELQECACQNGGNAIVFHGEGETGVHTGFGYSQQRVKAHATVLYVYPKEQ